MPLFPRPSNPLLQLRFTGPLTPGERLIQAAMHQRHHREMQKLIWAKDPGPRATDAMPRQPVELFFTGRFDEIRPQDVFDELRWGGRVVVAGPDEYDIARLAGRFNSDTGFRLEQMPAPVVAPPRGLSFRVPWMGLRGYYFVARKTHLVTPGTFTDRFTYEVALAPDPQQPTGYVVRKRVPTRQEALRRLAWKFPHIGPEELERRAHKLVDHVLPVFLTREAAMLQILQRELHGYFGHCVPRPLRIEKGEDGFVRQLDMNWLQLARTPITQLEFARQAAELLVALHDKAKLMHLDLRLDNMVVTDHGVAFVDFGSSVRIGEDVSRSPMLAQLFGEMMKASEIQRVLGKMIRTGHVTSDTLVAVHGRIDQGVDSFYLSMQINAPHQNPDTRMTVRYDPESEEARSLSALTAAFLRPKHRDKYAYKTATDLLRGIQRIERKLKSTRKHKRQRAA